MIKFRHVNEIIRIFNFLEFQALIYDNAYYTFMDQNSGLFLKETYLAI